MAAIGDLLRQFKGKKHGPLVQFIKYGIGGAAATAVHVTIFYGMASLVFPALAANDRPAQLLHLPLANIPDAIRARNSIIDNFAAFLLSNLTAYLINIAWVFEAGRHHWAVEVGMFYAVSGISMVAGSFLMGWLIGHYGIATSIAFGANLVTALAINFAMRKFVIFKG